jgi:DNA-binding response OmpR family regulator
MAEAIAEGFREAGFEVDVARHGSEAEERARAEPYAAIVLDAELPDRDGIELCRAIRRQGISAPIMMLTAPAPTGRPDAEADDHLPKPVEVSVLVGRVRGLLRRSPGNDRRLLRFDDLALDPATRIATREGQAIQLSNKECLLLEYLMQNPNRVLSRSTIGANVWGSAFSSKSNVIDVYISALRKKLDREHEPPLIHTVVNAGYRFGSRDPA